MINISEEDKAIWRAGRTKKEVVITFPDLNITLTNSDIVEESLQLKESIESDTNLTYQGCIASQFKVSLINFMRDVRNENIEVTIASGDSDPVPIFKGYVFNQSNSTHEDIRTQLTCYDPLKKALEADVTTWYNGLSFPITIRNMRNSFFQRVGIPHESVNLINDGLTVAKSITDSNIYGREIIRDLCQLNAVFGQYGRDGVFHYRKLTASTEAVYPSETLYPKDDIYPREANPNETVAMSTYNSISYQPYHTAPLSRVIIVNADGAMGGSYGDTTKDTFYIQDNKLAWGVNMNLACQNILGQIKNITFTPATIKAKCLPYVECGDIILSNTRVNIVQSYVTSRLMEGIQALYDTFDSDSTQHRKAYRLSTATEISANSIAIEETNDNLATTNTNLATTNRNLETTNTNLETTNTNLSTTNTNVKKLGDRVTTVEGTLEVQGELIADKVSTQDFESATGRIGTLESDYAEINRVVASKISADYITSDHITSAFTRADASTFTYLKGSNCYFNTVHINSYVIDDEGGSRSLGLITVIDKNGGSHRVLGWR